MKNILIQVKNIFQELRANILLRYLVIFSLIVVLIILTMGTYIYRFYHHTIYKDFVESEEIWLEGIVSRHENDVSIINDIVIQIGQNSTLTDFCLEDAPFKSAELKERLYQYNMVSQFFSSLFCIYHGDSYLYNPTTSVELNRFLRKGFVLETTEISEFEELIYNSDSEMKILPEQEIDGYLAGVSLSSDKKAVIYICPVIPERTTTLLFVVDSRYYAKLIGSADEGHANYMIYKGKVITSSNGETVADEELLSVIDGMEDGSRAEQFSEGKYLVTKREGQSGMVYCSLRPMEDFTDKMLNEVWRIAALLLLCSVAAALIITWFSRSIFGKVKSLSQLLSEEPYFNLDKVEAGICTLVENSREQERESIPLRKSRLIRSLVKGEFVDVDTLYAEARASRINVRMPYYIVVLLGDRGSRDEHRAHEMMLKVIENEDLLDGYGVKLLDRNQSLFVLFSEEIKYLDIISRFFLQIGKDYCEDAVLAVSGIHTDPLDAPKAYQEANYAFDSRLLMDNTDVIRYEVIPERDFVEGVSEVYLQQLKNAVRRKDMGEMHQAVDEICSQLQAGKQSLLKFRLFCQELIRVLVREWPMQGNETSEIYSVFTLSQCLTLQDFKNLICSVCEKLILTDSDEEKNVSRLAESAMEYMKNHYMEYELNMGLLADYLKVTPAALAVEFKNDTGMPPSDYLAGLRLEQARILLIQTNMKIREISSAVGYEDDHMFMRRFKKYTGKTPGQYRKENTKKESDEE